MSLSPQWDEYQLESLLLRKPPDKLYGVRTQVRHAETTQNHYLLSKTLCNLDPFHLEEGISWNGTMHFMEQCTVLN